MSEPDGWALPTTALLAVAALSLVGLSSIKTQDTAHRAFTCAMGVALLTTRDVRDQWQPCRLEELEGENFHADSHGTSELLSGLTSEPLEELGRVTRVWA